MGVGFGKSYPPQHKPLVQVLIGAGCVVSEMPVDWVATASDFPRHNRIVSGLSRGVVIVEAAIKSGSQITAMLALEQGREVMAMPGSPLDPRNDDSNQFIRQGATLIRHAGDILEILLPMVEQGYLVAVQRSRSSQDRFDFGGAEEAAAYRHGKTAEPSGGNADDDRLIAVLGPMPVAIDDLVRAFGFAPRQVQLILLELDLAARIERHGNGMASLP
jgi:DNA processing protein